MSFSQVLGILRARFWIFLGTFVATVIITFGFSVLLPKQYTATSTIIVDYKGMDPILGMMMPAQLMPGYLATQVDIIQSNKVAGEVVKMMKVAESPIAREQWREATDGQGNIETWYAELLLKKLTVKPSRESSVVAIEFTGSDPRFAAGVANAFAEAYQRTNLELRVEPARQSAAWFDERMQQLRKNLEEAQARLNAYQREKGFTAQDERLDLEQGRLSELSAQYTAAQAQAADAMSRQRQVSEFLARGVNLETIPDILSNPLIQNLKSQLTMTEGRLQQTASQLGSNHPEVRRLEADIQSQKAKLKAEISAAATGVGNAARVAQKREAELRGALADQKTRLLKFNQGRDEQQVLIKEVESAQRAYDAASQRFQQTNLESQANQTNIAILTRATPPIEPSFPKFTLNMILSLLLGVLLGIGMALVVELLNRRVRSAQDLADALGAPVLGQMLHEGMAARSLKKLRGKGGVRKVSQPANAVAS